VIRFRVNDIQWLRPHEIVAKLVEQGELPQDGAPLMEVGERNRFDVNQGEIGNCWFLAPLALLAESKDFHKVVPAGQGFTKGYHGIFKFRFYRLGEWLEVVVDDRLPTRNGKLIYLRGREQNEFWSPLLEKAYAKLHGSYAALDGGLSIHAAVDFTGGIPKIIDLTNNLQEPRALFHLLKLTCKNKGLITCALGSQYKAEAERLGLQPNHAYSVTKVVGVWSKKTRESIPLVRLRNPHGKGKEWAGDWSDTSSEWMTISRRKRKKLGLDGEFYMNFNTDFLRLFGTIDLVHINPIRMELSEEKAIRKFNLVQFWGGWESGLTDGGVEELKLNPVHHFSLSRRVKSGKDCCVVISLAQEVLRSKREHHIGFRIFKYKDLSDLEKPGFFTYTRYLVGSSGTFVNSREVSETFNFEEGNYCIVPSTYHRHKVARFHLRLYVEYRWTVVSPNKSKSIRDKNCLFWCCLAIIRCTCCSTYCFPSCCHQKPAGSSRPGSGGASPRASGGGCCRNLLRLKCCSKSSESNDPSGKCCSRSSESKGLSSKCCAGSSESNDPFSKCCSRSSESNGPSSKCCSRSSEPNDPSSKCCSRSSEPNDPSVNCCSRSSESNNPSSKCCSRSSESNDPSSQCCSRSRESNGPSSNCCARSTDPQPPPSRCCRHKEEDEDYYKKSGETTNENTRTIPIRRGRSKPRCLSKCCYFKCECQCYGDDVDDYYEKNASAKDESVRMIPIQQLHENFHEVDVETVPGASGNQAINQGNHVISFQSSTNPAKPFTVYSSQVSTEIRRFYSWTDSKPAEIRILQEIQNSP